jgi:DHA1 family bicyclomycin/chloramphenicol resistance-like MFS transporter
MMRRFGARHLLGGATGAAAIAALVLAALVFAGMNLLWPFVALTLTLFFCLGLIMGPAFLTAMEPFGATAGAAAALGVGLEFTMSSVTTAIMSLASDGTARPMVGCIAIVACGGFATWCIFMKLVRPAHRLS